jgi:AraC family transcriptional regulator of adaptative response/methylated-DNA-[protein]-cysteine methyltransferase
MTIQGLWHAVARRDPAADGLFVYGVRSTHIYCRPSCPSRRPRADRVEYFPSAAMAEATGYRACRRCRPELAPADHPSLGRVRRACDAVARRPDAPWTSARMAQAGHASVVQLQRSFRDVLGLTPRDYVAACRRRRFLDELKRGESVTGALYASGYGSPSRVYGTLELPGMTPATYGRGGQGATIRWATTATGLGHLLVAATDRGLCFVALGPEPPALVVSLREEFPRAAIGATSASDLGVFLKAGRAIADSTRLPQAVPLDIRGTAFQWRVWRALTRIPAGETRAYSDVAAALGRPTATRAVARACATNPVSLVIPCHRVVGRTGSLTGYRWGTDVKRHLLAQEKGVGPR